MPLGSALIRVLIDRAITGRNAPKLLVNELIKTIVMFPKKSWSQVMPGARGSP